MDIDRKMLWVVCDCGAGFWHCERRPVKCGACGKRESVGVLLAAWQGGV